MSPDGHDSGAGEDTEGEGTRDEIDDVTVVQDATEAAESVIFSRYDKSEIRDVDVNVTFENYQLDIDIYLDAPDEREDPEQVADDAVLAARSAVDDLLL